CPTPARNEARLGRGPCALQPGAACPQVAHKRLGVGFVREAADAIVTVPHAEDVAPCGPTAPPRRPEVTDIVPGEVRPAGTGAPAGAGASPVGASRRPAGARAPPPARPP